MKRQIILFALCLYTATAFPQSIDEAKKFIYYERWDAAEEHFERIIKTSPQNLEAYYWLTKALLHQNDLEGAKKVQGQLHDFLSSNSKVKALPLNRVSGGELLLHEGKKDEAKAIFEQLQKETRNKKPEVLIAIATAYLDAKSPEYEYVLELLSKAEKKDKRNPKIFALRGDVYRRLNNGSKAVQAYMQALNADKSYSKASYGIGKIYLTQNNPEMFLRYFNEAISRDPAFAPAYYDLFYYYYFRDVNKAKGYLDKYLANSDPSLSNEYLLTDFLYASSQPEPAIKKAKALLEKEKDSAEPRLFKLIAYSYDALGDSTNALNYLQQYFNEEEDSNYVAKDFELKAKLLAKFPGNDDEVISSLQRAIAMDTLIANKVEYASQLATLFEEKGDKSEHARWLGKVYQLKTEPSNIDLYYWGVAHYAAGEYPEADSVFAVYTEKHPEHVQGYYWRAKSNALIDSTMEQGLAIPYYENVIEMASANTSENKALLIQAHGYLGAYYANVKKDYEAALINFDKIVELDPANDDALRYREILEKWAKAEAGN